MITTYPITPQTFSCATIERLFVVNLYRIDKDYNKHLYFGKIMTPMQMFRFLSIFRKTNNITKHRIYSEKISWKTDYTIKFELGEEGSETHYQFNIQQFSQTRVSY